MNSCFGSKRHGLTTAAFCSLALVGSFAGPLVAKADDSIGWDFGTVAATPLATYDRVNNASTTAQSAFTSVGAATIGNPLGNVTLPINTTAPSTGYNTPGNTDSNGNLYPAVAATGLYNIGNAARIGGLVTDDSTTTGSAYFAFNVTPAQALTITGFNFGSRGTGTGPLNYALYTSTTVAGVTTPLTALGNSGPLNANSAWQLVTDAFTLTAAPATTVNFRLYGYNGAGSPGSGTQNWRTDDWQLTYALVAAPEPTSLLLLGVAAGPLALGRRRRATTV